MTEKETAIKIFQKEMTIGRLIEDLQVLVGEGKCKSTDVIQVTLQRRDENV